MFGWLRRSQTSRPPLADIRETLFGDVPLAEWGAKSPEEPWCLFAEARQAIEQGRPEAAKLSLRRVICMPGLESRHYLQAWHFLRSLGDSPSPGEAKQLLGIVVEVPVERGLDVVACYADKSARYYNLSGGGVVVDATIPNVVAAIEGLFAASIPVVEKIGPWEGPRRGIPPAGAIRMSFLTPSGLHFGEGTFSLFERDPMAGPVISAATALLQTLTSLPAGAKQQAAG